jgi:hypothetical protein
MSVVYNDLAHPPATSISNKYAWRTADGSYNNIDIPDLGKVRLLQLQLSKAYSAGFFRLVHLILDQFNKPIHYPKINSQMLVFCSIRESQRCLCSIQGLICYQQSSSKGRGRWASFELNIYLMLLLYPSLSSIQVAFPR